MGNFEARRSVSVWDCTCGTCQFAALSLSLNFVLNFSKFPWMCWCPLTPGTLRVFSLFLQFFFYFSVFSSGPYLITSSFPARFTHRGASLQQLVLPLSSPAPFSHKLSCFALLQTHRKGREVTSAGHQIRRLHGVTLFMNTDELSKQLRMYMAQRVSLR